MISSSFNETKRLQELNIENAKKAHELQEKIEDAEKEYKLKITKAEDEIKMLKAEAKEETEKIKEEMITRAKQEKERLIEQAMNAKGKIREEIEGELLEKSIGYARQIIVEILGGENQRAVYDNFIDEVFEEMEKIDPKALDGVGTRQCLVRSSHKMTPSQKKRLEEILSSKMPAGAMHASPLQIEEATDREIIAGIIVQLGSLIIDGSLAAKFKKAAEALKHSSG